MPEAEYKALMGKVFPDEKLTSDMEAKMALAQNARKPKRGRLRSALIAAVILAGVLGASAIALTAAHLVDWSGNVVDNPDFSLRLKERDPEAEAERDRFWKGLENMPEGELWLVTDHAGRLNMRAPLENVSDYAEMVRRVKASSPQMMLPPETPLEGYTFVRGELEFYLSEKTLAEGVTLLSEEALGNGLWVEKYKLPETVRQDIGAFNFRFGGEKGTLFIRCELEPVDNGMSFFVEEGENSESVTFPGMDRGLYIPFTSSNYGFLHLRTGVRAIRCFGWENLQSLEELKRGGFMPMSYRAAHYTLGGSGLGKEELLAAARGLQ